MNAETQKQAELMAILNLVPYLDSKIITRNGPITLGGIVDGTYDKYLDGVEAYEVLKKALKNHPEYKSIQLVDQSSTNGTFDWKDDLIQGCTFRDAEGNYYITYRGTGDGRWVDNGHGMTANATEMQEAAAAYFDKMAEKYLIDASNKGHDIIVSGHSKGGNEAQYVYMMARHEEIIDKCIALDGQGFSDAAIKMFKKRYGDEYIDKLQEMYWVNGTNDYVHDLGYPIIPEDNTYFVPTSGNGFENYHMLENMITDDDGNYSGLQWIDPKTGKPYEQDEFGAFAKKLSENMMKLDDENLNGAAKAVMSFIDPYDNDDILGNLDVKVGDYVDLVAHGVPAVLQTLLCTEEGLDLIKRITTDAAQDIYDKYGAGGVIGTFMAGGVVLVNLAPVLEGLVISTVVIAKVLDFYIDSVNKIIDDFKRFAKLVSDIKDAIIETVDKVMAALRALSPGYKYATEYTNIVVDTYKLTDYATRLRDVNKRISTLDGRLDSLYWRVGLLDIWKLMQADLLTGYSWRLNRCASYLDNTASDFNSVEFDLTEKMQ